MDRYWLEKALGYISEHNSFTEASEIKIDDVNSIATISAIVKVNLPSRFIKAGITKTGVKEREVVIFQFTSSFPLEAPTIQLRHDFPRCFPHINPSENRVLPCIYDGNLSELLQQIGWMNEILNQLVDWLEKAASDDLINYDQGWEPMRNDHNVGFIQYDIEETLSYYEKLETSCLINRIMYENRKGKIFTGSLCNPKNTQTAHALYFITQRVICDYVPRTINKLSDLYEYAQSIGITDIKKKVEDIDLNNINEDKLFVILSVRRPVRIIGSLSNIEFLNFVISKGKRRKKKKRELKRMIPDCNVGMLYHIADRSQSLLKRISGMQTKIDEDKPIALVGCGSLGSKIGIHLARNGNGPFLCIDNDIFMPHNNARHALSLTWAENKAELLSLSIFSIGKIVSTPIVEDVSTVDFSKSRVIIDTTASLSVRSLLMNKSDLPPIISCNLYGKGRVGLMLAENKNKSCKLTHIWAYLYHQSLNNDDIYRVLFSSNLEKVAIGQSCSSQTLVVDDARVSLMAATMSLKIQHFLEIGIPKKAEIIFAQYDDNYSLRTVFHTVPRFIQVKSVTEKEWVVFVSEPLITRMRNIMHEKLPNETGGALLGSVFLYPKTVVVTDIIDAPIDSIETLTFFILGTEGLEKRIKDTEKMTNGKVTYLGTWHSHPYGGKASKTDECTFKKLLFVRNYEPTVCLIITENEVIMI